MSKLQKKQKIKLFKLKKKNKKKKNLQKKSESRKDNKGFVILEEKKLIKKEMN